MTPAKDTGLLAGATHAAVPEISNLSREFTLVAGHDDLVGNLTGSLPGKGVLMKGQTKVIFDLLGGEIPRGGWVSLRDSCEKNEKREERKKMFHWVISGRVQSLATRFRACLSFKSMTGLVIMTSLSFFGSNKGQSSVRKGEAGKPSLL